MIEKHLRPEPAGDNQNLGSSDLIEGTIGHDRERAGVVADRTAMLSDESSRLRGVSRRSNRGGAEGAVICAHSVSSSQSPLACWRAHGAG